MSARLSFSLSPDNGSDRGWHRHLILEDDFGRLLQELHQWPARLSAAFGNRYAELATEVLRLDLQQPPEQPFARRIHPAFDGAGQNSISLGHGRGAHAQRCQRPDILLHIKADLLLPEEGGAEIVGELPDTPPVIAPRNVIGVWPIER
jgi:hypothetical protein